MQIKRFEAEDMTDALRMVRREFGDDAVILSAKESRPGRFLRAFKKNCVEVTAAMDYPLDDEKSEDEKPMTDFSQQLSEKIAAGEEGDRVSLSNKTSGLLPKADLSKSAAPTASRTTPLTPPKPEKQVAKRWVMQHAGRDREEAFTGRADVDDGQDRYPKERMVAAPFYRRLDNQKVIVLVGGHGTGKSTAIAKLAKQCRLVESRSVALISLDRFSIGGNQTLEKISRILQVPLAIVRDADQLQAALDRHAAVDVVLIDTPGLGKEDEKTIGEIAALMDTANPDEIHLVVNATVRRKVVDGWVAAMQPVGIDRLLFTHMDEYGVDESLLGTFAAHRLPSAFFTDGVDLFDNLKETTVDALDRFCSSGEKQKIRVTRFSRKKTVSPLERETPTHPNSEDRVYYVANRNSELFHRPDCKSVKRINAENITAFSSIEQALEEGFKPCRACCNTDTTKSALAGGIAKRRVRAL